MRKEIIKHMWEIRKVKQALNKKIMSLPDNPNIKRINERCFIIMSNKLRDSWSPEFHDFKYQYRFIVERIIKTKTPARVIGLLKEIVNKGILYVEPNRMHFHPDVRQFIKEQLT